MIIQISKHYDIFSFRPDNLLLRITRSMHITPAGWRIILAQFNRSVLFITTWAEFEPCYLSYNNRLDAFSCRECNPYA